MSNTSKIISLVALTIFFAGWFDIFPESFGRNIGLIVPPFLLLVVLVLTGGGLSKQLRKILTVFSTLVFCVVVYLTYDYLQQGGIGALIPVFFGGLTCALMYIILLIVELSLKLKSKYTHNNSN